jgi:deoxyribodipyrimidine photo-lyase
MMKEVSIFWFRRDLRLEDNAGLWKALKSGHPVVPIFIFDRNILDKLEDKSDARVSFLHQRLTELQSQLTGMGSSLHVFYGTPEEAMNTLIQTYTVKGVFLNRDYEPYAHERDEFVFNYWSEHEVPVVGAKDHVIFEKNEVVKADGTPYLVFSPYGKAWRKKLTDYHAKAYPNAKYFENFLKQQPIAIPTLESMGFRVTGISLPSSNVDESIIKTYDATRNFPANERGTTRLGMHLRFGSISVRSLLRKGLVGNDTFVNELIWRDFFQMALYYFPDSREKAIKPKYDLIPWETNMDHFKAWREGRTGYPIVDAGMRELNTTGYMHNRVRMIVASFLTKHLLIDWRLGERYFAEKLLDFDLASNIGGWQWASGSGLDAAPYFRVFNPTSQLEKFDKQLTYVKRWVPEYGTAQYPEPIVEHKWARERCLDRFKTALANA